MYDTPASHPSISKEELDYIQNSIGSGKEDETKISETPWAEIASSKAVWAIIVAHVGHGYGLYTLLTLLPTYLKTALHFDIKQVPTY